jgi:hypothetical protein
MAQRWTDREIKYLESKYLNQPTQITADRLNRTMRSVVKKAMQLGLGKNNNIISANKLAECFNVTPKVVLRWIEQYNLPCKIIHCKNGNRYSVEVEEFWMWAKANKNVINWTKYDYMTLALEPEWVRQEKFSCKEPNKGKAWTVTEINSTKSMLRRGMSYKDIAKELGRTRSGVAHKCVSIYNGE